ncbi:MAG: 6,7-dimethyl-8-ribityllumazine synthase [Chlamydiae bacterium]|nr:6,7-dimethyl-8-ribityllumazine synthase [Chlamydiota bacterium]
MSDDQVQYDFSKIDVPSLKFAIVQSKFNFDITTKLQKGAEQALLEAGGDPSQIKTYFVPGAFEIPLVAQKLAKTKLYDAILCLGAVIKGETAHFEYISESTIQGIQQVALETETPILCGVLTTYNIQQAEERVSKKLNIGRECLFSALDLIQSIQFI